MPFFNIKMLLNRYQHTLNIGVLQRFPILIYVQLHPKYSFANNLYKTGAFNTNHGVHTPSCSCSSSQFLYSLAGHIITGDLNIIQNKQLRDLISKGPKYREPQSFSWKYNFKIIVDSVDEYPCK